MFLSYFTLFVALSLSAVAAWYSIIGLTAIFAAAVVPIIIMGGILEVAKITATVWLHEHWHRCRLLMKLYLVPAVVLLMVITSLGIFGFLSKAHLDQAVPTGDVAAQVALLDEKIKTQRDNVETARAALKQMDNQVNELLSRSVDDRGAERAVQIRRNQARERTALQADIASAQAEITRLNLERAPVATELRKVEAEIGPIKYIAALIYGDDPDQNLLEKAVRWVIILLVVVFDPLAIMLVLAATESMRWHRQTQPAYEPDDGPLTDSQLEQIQATVDEWKQDNKPVNDPQPEVPDPVLPDPPVAHEHPYLTKQFVHFEPMPPMVAPVPNNDEKFLDDESLFDDIQDHTDDDIDEDEPQIKAAMREWKRRHQGQTVKHQRELLDQGRIDQLPWIAYIQAVPDAGANMYRGTEFPTTANKGDGFVKLDSRPTRIYKHNGTKWIEVDKTLSDLYSYDVAYIDWLIERLSVGEYDPDLLTNSEQDQIAERINQTKGN